MTPEQVLHAAIVRDPGDDLAWLALADWLEETGQESRAELLRLTRKLKAMSRDDSRRSVAEARLCKLLAAGVKPIAPEWDNSVGIQFVLIPTGRFPMGERHDVKDVLIERPFWMGKYPVTRGEWQRVMGDTPSRRRARVTTLRLPVDSIAGSAIHRFFGQLALSPEEAGQRYRLPSEVQWEYACRATTVTPFHFGAKITVRDANISPEDWGKRDDIGTTPVGNYPPNAFGLYDMHGNVGEMCYHGDGSDLNVLAVRGGSCAHPARLARAASRERRLYREERADDIGFRVLMEWMGV